MCKGKAKAARREPNGKYFGQNEPFFPLPFFAEMAGKDAYLVIFFRKYTNCIKICRRIEAAQSVISRPAIQIKILLRMVCQTAAKRMSSVPKPLPWQEGRRATDTNTIGRQALPAVSHKAVCSGRSEKVPTSSLPSRMPTPVPTGCPVRFYPDPKGVPTAKSPFDAAGLSPHREAGNGHSSGKSAFWIESFIGFSFGKKLILVILFYHIKRNCGIITERQMRYSAAPNPFSAFAQGGRNGCGRCKKRGAGCFLCKWKSGHSRRLQSDDVAQAWVMRHTIFSLCGISCGRKNKTVAVMGKYFPLK